MSTRTTTQRTSFLTSGTRVEKKIDEQNTTKKEEEEEEEKNRRCCRALYGIERSFVVLVICFFRLFDERMCVCVDERTCYSECDR